MVLRLHGRYIKTFDLLFDKNGKCIMTKTNKKGAEEHYTEKCRLFSECDLIIQKL